MSTLSTFLDPQPYIGELIYLVDNANYKPTLGGKEFLRSGLLIPISGYTDLETSNPWMTLNVGTDKSNAGGGVSHSSYLGTSNGYFYGVGASIPCYTPDGVTWTAYTTDLSTQCSDAFVWGTYAFHMTDSGSVYRFLTTTETLISTTNTMKAAAVNAAGTLAVMIGIANGGAGQAWTATVATTWTSRTPTAITASPSVRLAQWLDPAGAFAYLCSNGKLLTSTDGYTLTDRGLVITGVTNVSAPVSNIPAGEFGARSSSVTMFVAQMTVSGVSGVYLVRMTSATAWTCTLLSEVMPGEGVVSTYVPKIVNINGTFVIYGGSIGIDTTYRSFYCHKSTDNGATWVKMPLPLNPTSTSSITGIGYANSVYFSYGTSAASRFTFHTTAPPTATHLGMVAVATIDASNRYPGYVRIK